MSIVHYLKGVKTKGVSEKVRCGGEGARRQVKVIENSKRGFRSGGLDKF